MTKWIAYPSLSRLRMIFVVVVGRGDECTIIVDVPVIVDPIDDDAVVVGAAVSEMEPPLVGSDSSICVD